MDYFKNERYFFCLLLLPFHEIFHIYLRHSDIFSMPKRETFLCSLQIDINQRKKCIYYLSERHEKRRPIKISLLSDIFIELYFLPFVKNLKRSDINFLYKKYISLTVKIEIAM